MRTIQIKNIAYGLLGFTCFTALSVSDVQAAGFYVQGQSVSHLGDAFSGTASNPKDASTIFFNPAGMSHLDGRQVNLSLAGLYTHTEIEDQGSTLGGALLSVAGQPTDDGGNPGSINIIPSLYYAAPITDAEDLWLGVSVNSPFGLNPEYNDAFFARSVSTKTDLRVIELAPAISYAPQDWISIGGALVYQKTRGNLQSIAPNGDSVRLKGDDTAYGYKVGVIVEPTDSTKIGIDYRSEIKATISGNINQNDTTVASARADLTYPEIASIGVTQGLTDALDVSAQVTYFGWSSFDELDVIADPSAVSSTTAFNYNDTVNYSIGLNYQYDDQWTFRIGYQFDESPTQLDGRSTINPDEDRSWYTVGTTYKYSDAFEFDFAAAYVDVDDADLDITRTFAGPTTLEIDAEAQDSYGIYLALGINYKF